MSLPSIVAVMTLHLTISVSGFAGGCVRELARSPVFPAGLTGSYKVDSRTASPSSPQQSFCCSMGLISDWTFALTNLTETTFQAVGSVFATCNNGERLPVITYGFNDTEDGCSNDLADPVFRVTPANNTITYGVNIVLASLFEGNLSMDCGDDYVPIGFSASSSCFGLTSFQVVCGRPSVPDLACPAHSEPIPLQPLGSAQLVDVEMPGNTDSNTIISTPAVSYCCSTGHVVNWLISSIHQGNQSNITSLGISCSDGSSISSANLEAEPGSSECQTGLGLVSVARLANPPNNIFTAASRSELNAFLQAGADSTNTSSFQCANNAVAIGFKAGQTCFGIFSFQVICGNADFVGKVEATDLSSLSIWTRTDHNSTEVIFTMLAVVCIVMGAAFVSLTIMLGCFLLVHLRASKQRAVATGNDIEAGLDTAERGGLISQSQTGGPDTVPGALNNNGMNLHMPEDDIDLTGPPRGFVDSTQIRFLHTRNRALLYLGRRAFGVVVIGQSGRDTVAVKMANGRGERAQAMLLAEIRLLSQLRCTYIVKYLGYSIHNNAYMLLTAFHARGNLFDSLRASDEFQFKKGGKRALYCICIAMIHVHSRGVAHRDLKSANVLITQDGTMRLADMGQAWLVGSEDLHTRTGTEGWRSPEQRRGEVVTLKTDVFSLGVVFCEVCTRENPGADNRRGIRVPDDCPQGMLDLIDKMLCRNPEERPTVESALDSLLALNEPGSGDPGPSTRASRN